MTISVAMATYNGGTHLQDQLDSLAMQSELPTELIVCDDGSTDSTEVVLNSFAATARFPVIINRNRRRLGYRDNFLQAARMCRGTHIAFCDQDDIWSPEKLKRCAKAFSTPAVVLAVHGSSTIDETGRIRKSAGSVIHRDCTRSASPADLWTQAYGYTMVARREIFGVVPTDQSLLDPVGAHDDWLWLAAIALGEIAFMSDTLVYHRRHATNASRTIEQSTTRARAVRSLAASVERLRSGAEVHAARARTIKAQLNSYEASIRRTLDTLSSMHSARAALLMRRANLADPSVPLHRRAWQWYGLLKNEGRRSNYPVGYGALSAARDLLRIAGR